jgi:F-type H+-transporting ATPase subunit gamma
MAAQLRVLRQRIRAVDSTKKITRAQELIASSRIVRAQARVLEARPYFRALYRALSAAASSMPTLDHPLVRTADPADRAAVVLFTADRGFAGAYSSNVIREGRALQGLLEAEGKKIDLFVVGRKGIAYHTFRGHTLAGEWSGFTENPSVEDAQQIAAALQDSFNPGGESGFDEIHIVYTHFYSMVTQRVRARRLLPLEVEETTDVMVDGEVLPLYEFEPSPAEVLDALMPRLITGIAFLALLNAAASELAARRRAMKSATDNAEELIRTLSRQANAARQSEITQEISEIVGGADALAAVTAGAD